MHVEKSTHLLNPFTQQQIAEITGQTSVNVNRVFADMERQGLIRRKGRDIEFPTGLQCGASAASSPAICSESRLFRGNGGRGKD